jgi:hypothetical protein
MTEKTEFNKRLWNQVKKLWTITISTIEIYENGVLLILVLLR